MGGVIDPSQNHSTESQSQSTSTSKKKLAAWCARQRTTETPPNGEDIFVMAFIPVFSDSLCDATERPCVPCQDVIT